LSIIVVHINTSFVPFGNLGLDPLRLTTQVIVQKAGLKAPIVCAKAIAAEDHGTKSNVLPILIRM